MNSLKPVFRHFSFVEQHFNVLLIVALLLIVFAVVAGNVLFSQGRIAIYIFVLVPLVAGLFILGDLLIGRLYMRIWRTRRSIKNDP